MVKVKPGRRWDKWQVEPLERGYGAELLYWNNRYHVFLGLRKNPDPEGPDIIHLSIRRDDRGALIDWRDLQRIKNEIVGPEIEMVQMFPRESQVVDTSNQFHLWGFKSETPHLTNAGFGWNQGRLIHDGIDPDLMRDETTKNSVQRPMENPLTPEERAEMERQWELQKERMRQEDEV
jgi:hypothetical protein